MTKKMAALAALVVLGSVGCDRAVDGHAASALDTQSYLQALSKDGVTPTGHGMSGVKICWALDKGYSKDLIVGVITEGLGDDLSEDQAVSVVRDTVKYVCPEHDTDEAQF